MDIIDVLLGKALSATGQIDAYAARAQKAVRDAASAVTTAESAAETAAQASEDAAAAVTALTNIEDTIDDEIDKLLFELTTTTASNSNSKNLSITYPSGESDLVNNVVKYYTTTGQNEDGTMTQKAITNAIGSGGGGGGQSNLGPEHAGDIVVVGNDGYITAGEVSEQDIKDLLDKNRPSKDGTFGLEIDYTNKTFTRLGAADGITAGADYNLYAPYGGRMKCNVADNGKINAFYGESAYREDGSNGQVMVYQPKFYYRREIIEAAQNTVGSIVKKERIYVSSTSVDGFKLHPLFIDENGNELQYVLLGSYETCFYDASAGAYAVADEAEVDFSNDKLASIANAKPTSGVGKNFSIINAEQMARNRGTGWHISNIKAESANQMLFITEYAAMNSQASIELGICKLNAGTNENIASQTGSTASLGNASGAASSTTNITNGQTNTYYTAGYRAIAYRGLENVWGNMWHYIGGIKVVGDGTQGGGIPYVANSFNYDYTSNANYSSVGFSLPNSSNYISALGIGSATYDWVLMPAAADGTSALPIGDAIWTNVNLNATVAVCGGGPSSTTHGEKDGIFYYACDSAANTASRLKGARLMYVPDATSANYASNYAAWQSKIGG